MSKPAFAICELQSADLISAFLKTGLYNTSCFYIRNCKPLPSFLGCAGRFVSYLVANPEDRFSRDEAQINTARSSSNLFCTTKKKKKSKKLNSLS